MIVEVSDQVPSVVHVEEKEELLVRQAHRVPIHTPDRDQQLNRLPRVLDRQLCFPELREEKS